MRRFLLLSAVWLAGCDFNQSLRVCHETGGCSREGADGGGPDGGGDLDGGGGADGGGTPFSSTPVFFTSSGWGWEFPFPAGPGLHSIAAVNDDEVWATGDDDSVLHYARGTVTFSRAGNGGQNVRGGVVVYRPDAGPLIVSDSSGTPRAYSLNGSSWMGQPFPIFPAAAELGENGVPWFGGEWQTTSGRCSPAGAGIAEGNTPLCTPADAGNSFIVGLDPRGWALDDNGDVLRREVDGGATAWRWVLDPDPKHYQHGDLLALSDDDVLLVGEGPGRSRVVSLDGGIAPVFFNPGGSAFEIWTSLVRSPDQQSFFVGGQPGVYRCPLVVPLDVGACTLELQDPLESLEALSVAGSTVFAVGDDGQLLRREVGATWSTLLPGSVGGLRDVWGDPDGTVWAVSENGVVLRRTDAGWDQARPVTSRLDAIARTGDGQLWVAGDELLASLDFATQQLTPATLLHADGGGFTLAGTGVRLVTVRGTERGNTWAAGYRLLLGYGADGTWTEVPLPPGGQVIADLWVSDGGTAWAVGGYLTHLVLFWDGTRWLDRSPPGTEDLRSVWGISPTEVFVVGAASGYHYRPDGGVSSWTSLDNTLHLDGKVTADGGFVVFGGGGTQVFRSINGAAGAPVGDPRPPGNRYFDAMRLIGSKLYVAGGDHHSYLLSIDAGL